jgi:hypothetical protein
VADGALSFLNRAARKVLLGCLSGILDHELDSSRAPLPSFVRPVLSSRSPAPLFLAVRIGALGVRRPIIPQRGTVFDMDCRLRRETMKQPDWYPGEASRDRAR